MKIFQKSPKRLFLSICLILRTTNYMAKKLKWLKIDSRASFFWHFFAYLYMIVVSSKKSTF